MMDLAQQALSKAREGPARAAGACFLYSVAFMN